MPKLVKHRVGDFNFKYTLPQITHHKQKALAAYYLWLADGLPESDGLKYWYEAEKQHPELVYWPKINWFETNT